MCKIRPRRRGRARRLCEEGGAGQTEGLSAGVCLTGSRPVGAQVLFAHSHMRSRIGMSDLPWGVRLYLSWVYPNVNLFNMPKRHRGERQPVLNHCSIFL